MTKSAASRLSDEGTSVPADPWDAGWIAPTGAEVRSRHESARRHQQDGQIPSQGASRARAEQALAPERFVGPGG